jgi:hypothetical protein
VIARNGNQVANNRAYRLRPFGADWMTEQLRAAAQRQSAHGGISRELGKRAKGRTGLFLHPLRRLLLNRPDPHIRAVAAQPRRTDRNQR